MGAKVICMASAKGGSGKTILTTTFSHLLTALNKKVLILDADASTNGLTLMYLKEVMLQKEIAIAGSRAPGGVFQLFQGKFVSEIISLNGGVYFLPATYSFINTENVELIEYRIGLMHFLKQARENYDYIFLDAQAGSDNYAAVAINRDISDEVIIVSEYDPLSAAGVERLKGIFREDLTYVRTWVLLNKMLPDFVQSFSDFLEVAKYLSPIPWDADVVRAYARRKLAIDLDKGNEFTLAVMQTLKSLLGDAISRELDDWVTKRSTLIREPVEQQYHDVEKRLNDLLEMKMNMEKKYRLRTKLIRTGGFIAIYLSLAATILWFLEIYKKTPSDIVTLSSVVVWILAGIMGAGISLIVGERIIKLITSKKSPQADYIEQSRIRRQMEILEEKLRKLEVLRSADLETLIKSKKTPVP